MKVYLIGGKARHGKDTLGKFMKEYYDEHGKKACIMHISNYIKHFAIDYFGWNGQEETKPRTLLQHLGTDIIREEMNKPMFFINRLIEDMEVLKNFYQVIIVTDIRFPMEFESVTKAYKDAVNIHIIRPDLVSELTSTEQKHITETALDNFDNYKYRITNKSLEDLKLDAEYIINKEEKQ